MVGYGQKMLATGQGNMVGVAEGFWLHSEWGAWFHVYGAGVWLVVCRLVGPPTSCHPDVGGGGQEPGGKGLW